MRISTITIKNFRSLRDVTIGFEDVTTFVGPNGTGKSTVLRALDWFFNGTKDGDLTEVDCSHGFQDQNIIVEVTFDRLSDTDRAELAKYATEGVDAFTAWKIRDASTGREYTSANAKGYAPFAAIRETGGATDKRKLYGELRTAEPGLGLPAVSSGAAVDEAMNAWEATHADQLTEAPEGLQTNFFGFNSNGKMSGLFDYVLVTADLRANEEALDNRGSIIGRILEKTVDRTLADDAIGKIVEDSRAAQQKVYDDAFKGQLAAMTSSLNEVVDRYSPGRRLKVRPSEVELRAPKTTFQVSILEAERETSVDRQGHGFQRTLLISALQLLAQSGAAGDGGVICLAIEEPELFQHPIQAQAFAKVLRSLAEDATQGVQVVYATHSPYFLEARKFSQVRRLVRADSALPDVTVHSSSVERVKGLLEGHVDDATVDRQLDGTISNRLPVAIFANTVLLVEGTTEEAVIQGVADRTSVGRLESLGISVVSVGGKSNIVLTHAILVSLGIPTHCLFDGDGGFEARSVAQGKDAAAIAQERANHALSNRKLLKYFGLTGTDFPAELEADDLTIVADTLEELLDTWPEWKLACAKLEDEAKIDLRKNNASYRQATLEAAGSPCELLVRLIDKLTTSSG